MHKNNIHTYSIKILGLKQTGWKTNDKLLYVRVFKRTNKSFQNKNARKL